MEIVAPGSFAHAGQLVSRASYDPRQAGPEDSWLDIDMRACTFIQPAAILWAIVCLLLERSCRDATACRLLVPENLGVCVHLKSLGVLRVLQESGVEVDDRGVPERANPQVVMPLSRFSHEAEVDRLANEATERLRVSAMGAANLYPVVAEVFAELALNAVQHSESPIGALGLVQFYEYAAASRFVCAVADGGIGIRASLQRNPELRRRASYDWTAIEVAVEEGVSGTGSQRRGIGLFGVVEEMRHPGRQLIMHSGKGMLRTGESALSRAERIEIPFPGTLASASIPT